MRRVLSFLISVSILSMNAPAAHAGIICADPAASTPNATPTAHILPDAAFPSNGGELTVFAAASLTDAFTEIAAAVEADHAGMDITIETGGSQQLVTQLEEGADADVLATADDITMLRARNSDLLAGEPMIFAHNRLVIITPADNPAGIASIEDLANDDVLLVLANGDVPAGRYATQAFCAYAASEAAPEGFIEAITDNTVSAEPDVRHVLTKVQVGEADAGVVYASDATASDLRGIGLTVIEFPAELPITVQYPIAAVRGGDEATANAFITFVLSDHGQHILRRYGFD